MGPSQRIFTTAISCALRGYNGNYNLIYPCSIPSKGRLHFLVSGQRGIEQKVVRMISVKKEKNGQWLCGSVGRAVASNARGQQYESSHQQNLFILNICLL